MTRAEILDCLTDRPCDVCKFHESGKCERWDCVFEEKPDEPEQKIGHWIENTYELSREFWDRTTECSVCGYKLGGAMPNFCPNCGAKMAESEE